MNDGCEMNPQFPGSVSKDVASGGTQSAYGPVGVAEPAQFIYPVNGFSQEAGSGLVWVKTLNVAFYFIAGTIINAGAIIAV